MPTGTATGTKETSGDSSWEIPVGNPGWSENPRPVIRQVIRDSSKSTANISPIIKQEYLAKAIASSEYSGLWVGHRYDAAAVRGGIELQLGPGHRIILGGVGKRHSIDARIVHQSSAGPPLGVAGEGRVVAFWAVRGWPVVQCPEIPLNPPLRKGDCYFLPASSGPRNSSLIEKVLKV